MIPGFPVMVVAFLAAGSAPAADLPLDLSKGWRMKPGDDAAWSASAFDDSAWKQVEVGLPWEKAGFPGLDGFAWLRVRFTVPVEWRDLPEVRDFGSLRLGFGSIDDADETWFNGVRVGATGSMPPDYETAWDRPRSYGVPAGLVNWGGGNTVAVRVYDGQNEGGIAGGPVSLRPAAARDMIRMELEPVTPDGVFPAGRRLEAVLVLRNEAKRKLAGELVCEWTDDSAAKPRVLARTSSKVAVPAGGRVTRTFRYAPRGPGFHPVSVAMRPGAGDEVRARLVLASAPERVKGPDARPADFDGFWKARLGDLAAVAPAYSVEPRPDRSTAGVKAFLVSMRSYGGVRLKGWLTVPDGKGPWPGILSVAGYGGEMQPDTGRPGMVVLALDIRGHGLSRADVDPGDGEIMYLGLTGNPADYFYVGAYLDCVRGVDFLCSRPEVDASRIGVEGGSQGGGLSFATAGLDPRIAACTADVPWLCDWPDYAVTAPWAVENFPKLLKERPDLSGGKLLGILGYVDAMNMTPRIRCPVMVSLGLVDDVCPPRTVMAACNRIASPKTVHYYPHGGHWGGGNVHEAIRKKWLAKALGAAQ